MHISANWIFDCVVAQTIKQTTNKKDSYDGHWCLNSTNLLECKLHKRPHRCCITASNDPILEIRVKENKQVWFFIIKLKLNKHRLCSNSYIYGKISTNYKENRYLFINTGY